MKRGQVNAEYAIVVVVSLFIVVPAAGLFVNTYFTSQEETFEHNSHKIGLELLAQGKELYYGVGNPKTTLTNIDVSGIASIEIEGGKNIIIRSLNGEVQLYESSVPLSSHLNAENILKADRGIVLRKFNGPNGPVILLEALTDNPFVCLDSEDLGSCSDGIDNDCDALIDNADTDCCNVDADGDGYTDRNACAPEGLDCDDSNVDVRPFAEELCDGLDNDCDGTIDDNPLCGICDDGFCHVGEACGTDCAEETHCFDGIDNDLDGVIDSMDNDCRSFDCGDGVCRVGEICSLDCDPEGICSDGIDNDQDGIIDVADSPDCDIVFNNGECEYGEISIADCPTEDAGVFTCEDEVDNDLDSLIDCNDPDCCGVCGNCGPTCGNGICEKRENCPADCPNEVWCHDGVDNDGDLDIDTDEPCNTPVRTLSCATFNTADHIPGTGCPADWRCVMSYNNAGETQPCLVPSRYENTVCCQSNDGDQIYTTFAQNTQCSGGGLLAGDHLPERNTDFSSLTIESFNHPDPETDDFLRGDTNEDGVVDISDSIYLLYFLNGERTPRCYDAADANDDGIITLEDSEYILSYLFEGGPIIPEPFPAPGRDPTDDFYDCKVHDLSYCMNSAVGSFACQTRDSGCLAEEVCVIGLKDGATDGDNSKTLTNAVACADITASDSSVCCYYSDTCPDSVCAFGEACIADCIKETHCSDGIDNDQDGLIDLADSADCVTVCGDGYCGQGEICPDDCPSENAGALTCNDYVNNDGDVMQNGVGCIDLADADCGGQESTLEQCKDGLDNDCDGVTDCFDSDCSEPFVETYCDDGCDNDGDGLIDLEDLDCVGAGYLKCQARTSVSGCRGEEVCAFRFQNQDGEKYNAHIQDCSYTDYDFVMCCQLDVVGEEVECTGYEDPDGTCWHLGDAGLSCEEVCADNNLECHDADWNDDNLCTVTETHLGSSCADCYEVSDATAPFYDGSECTYRDGTAQDCKAYTTGIQRACKCHQPTSAHLPAASPSPSPTASPTSGPTAGPSASPSASPSVGPSALPSPSPTIDDHALFIYPQIGECRGELVEGLLSLADDDLLLSTNAHVAPYTHTYNNKICIGASYPYEVECNYRTSCRGTEECIMGFQNDADPPGMTNAHVALCEDDYAFKICCNVRKIDAINPQPTPPPCPGYDDGSGGCWINPQITNMDCDTACYSEGMVCDAANWNDDASCQNADNAGTGCDRCELRSDDFAPSVEIVGVERVCTYRDGTAQDCRSSGSGASRLCRCVEPTPYPSPGGSPFPTPTSTGFVLPSPTATPTAGPTVAPTAGPTAGPTTGPTAGPTSGPTAAPSAGPSVGPTA